MNKLGGLNSASVHPQAPISSAQLSTKAPWQQTPPPLSCVCQMCSNIHRRLLNGAVVCSMEVHWWWETWRCALAWLTKNSLTTVTVYTIMLTKCGLWNPEEDESCKITNQWNKKSSFRFSFPEDKEWLIHNIKTGSCCAFWSTHWAEHLLHLHVDCLFFFYTGQLRNRSFLFVCLFFLGFWGSQQKKSNIPNMAV